MPQLDVFNRVASTLAGVINPENVSLVFADGRLNTLVQNLSMNYAHNVGRFYEISGGGSNGSPRVYLTGGRTGGTMQINRIIGPRVAILAFYEQYGDVCNAANNNLNLTASAADCMNGGAAAQGEQVQFQARNCVLVNMGLNVSAEAMIISESSALQLVSLVRAGS